MAIHTDIDGEWKTSYEGRVLHWYERNGYQDSDWYADVWDDESDSIKVVLFDTTRCGCHGYAELDATDEVLRKVYRMNKQLASLSFDRGNRAQAMQIRKGDDVLITKGRKVKKGSVVPCFWAGTRYNPYSRTEEHRIGVEVDGERMFINAENAVAVGWESRLIHGVERKRKIRRMAIQLMPIAYRDYFENYFDKTCKNT